MTLHDGWWLSPRQFLTTPSGRLVDVRDPLGHMEVMAAFDAEQQQQDRQRRVELEQVLAALLHDWRCHRPSPKCTSTQEC